jgi:hypothetical protein
MPPVLKGTLHRQVQTMLIRLVGDIPQTHISGSQGNFLAQEPDCKNVLEITFAIYAEIVGFLTVFRANAKIVVDEQDG